jgi:hypothetical protein
MTVADNLSDTSASMIRVPSNLMAHIRASYDSREKVLDWMLAFGVVIAMVWAFRDDISAMLAVPMPNADPNAGRTADQQPNQDVAGAFPPSAVRPDLYSYNMPRSRRIRYAAGPSGTPPPSDPSQPATYPD